MSSAGSVSDWIGRLKAGDRAVVQQLLKRYLDKLTTLARKRLQSLPRRGADEEDVALSAFQSAVRGIETGHFPQLCDRNDLWRVFVALTIRKAIDLVRRERRHRATSWRAAEADFETLLSQEPTPEAAAQWAEECQRLLDLLGDDELRLIAIWKLEDYTNEEIAAKLGCVCRTVERKLRLIRQRWEQESTS